MDLYKWISKNRRAIDLYSGSQYKNDEERRLWVLNDEYLYKCCKSNITLEEI